MTNKMVPKVNYILKRDCLSFTK